LKLGDSIAITKGNLSFKLREVLAFSPADECSLFWYDTLRGDMHGYQVSNLVVLGDEGFPLYPEVTQQQMGEHPVLSEFQSMYWRYRFEHTDLPWGGRPHMQKPDFVLRQNAKSERSGT